MKILIGWFGHETNTFSRRQTNMDLLISQGFWEGDALIDTFRGTPSYLGGMIQCAADKKIDLIPTLGVENAGPPLTDACLNIMVDKILTYVQKHLGAFDGICFAMHGAGCSVSHNDIESHILSAIRSVVGDKMPITITLDLHGNISDKMCQLATGLFGIKDNPHTDYHITGYEAMGALISAVEYQSRVGRALFATCHIKLPLLMPITSNQSGAYKAVKEFINRYKKENDLLDAAFFPGFPYADHPDIEATVFVTSKNDPDGKADSSYEHAKNIAKYVWSRRKEIVPEKALSAGEAVDKAESVLRSISSLHRKKGSNRNSLIVINEMSDNPGGGAPGDGTHLLKAMLSRNIPNSAFGYIYDPDVVQYAMEQGIGKRISIPLGGKLEEEKFHGSPVKLDNARICTLSEGKMVATTPLMHGIPGSFGPTVTLQCGHVKVIVASVANQTYDDRIFFVGGVDIRQMNLIGLKSSQHFRAFYDKVATEIIPADPMGILASDLTLYDYRNLNRAVYPLDQNSDYRINLNG